MTSLPFRRAPMYASCTRWRLIIVGVVSLFAVSGCGRQAPDYSPYTPGLDQAQEAVRLGLEAWKADQPPGELPGTRPVIHVTDAGRKAGQTLVDYRILGEARGSAGRTIAVILQLDHPREELRARYIVVGIDPLWVFRQEDYDLLMHWDHHMPATSPEGEPPAPDQTQATVNPAVAPAESDRPASGKNQEAKK